jgi:hypothetical protein
MAVWLGGGVDANQLFYMEPSVTTGGNALTFTLFMDRLFSFLPANTIILADNAAIHAASFPVVGLGAGWLSSFTLVIFYLNYILMIFSFIFLSPSLFIQLRGRLLGRGMAHDLATIPAYSPFFSPIELCFGRMKTEAKKWRDVNSLVGLQQKLLQETPNLLTLPFVESCYTFCGYPV